MNLEIGSFSLNLVLVTVIYRNERNRIHVKTDIDRLDTDTNEEIFKGN